MSELRQYNFEMEFVHPQLGVQLDGSRQEICVTFTRLMKGDEPVITAGADGTLYVDGELLTYVIRDAADYAEAKGDYADEKGDYADEKGDYALEKGNFADTKAQLADTKAQLADTKAALAQTKADLADAAADRANEISDHPLYINTSNYHWMKWNEQTDQYEDTGIMASCTPYATFEINLSTGILEVETDSYYAGPDFSIEEGNLVITI